MRSVVRAHGNIQKHFELYYLNLPPKSVRPFEYGRFVYFWKENQIRFMRRIVHTILINVSSNYLLVYLYSVIIIIIFLNSKSVRQTVSRLPENSVHHKSYLSNYINGWIGGEGEIEIALSRC